MKFPMIFAILLTALLTSCTATAEEETAPPVNIETISETETDDPAASDRMRITEGGTHTLTGSYDRMIVVDAGAEDVTLVLDGAEITSSGKAAILVKKAGTVTVTLADGSENKLTGRKGIDSAAELLLNGGGKLTVEASEGHGIASDASITLADGEYVITTAKDGIHAENEIDPTFANILLTGGNVSIVSEGDGVSATGTLQADAGQLLINAGGGPENAEPHQDDRMMGFGGGHGFFGGWETDSAETTEETDSVSRKALKSGGDMLLNDGMFTLGSSEDTIHTDANLTVNGGAYHLSAGDDVVHADLALTVNGGLFQILESYEGIEAKTIDVNGGELHIKASDDGFNASGGTGANRDPMAAEEGVYLTISGGTIFLDADGDGLDSNGDLTVNGGVVYVAGPTNSANGAIDYAGNAAVHGGTVIAAGASGMAESFGQSSTQGAVMVNTGNQAAGSAVTLTDADGNILAEYTFGKAFSNVVITAPGITDGGTYTLTAGTYSETITMDGLLYGSGNGMFGGGMGGNFGGGRGDGGRKHENRPDMGGERPSMPEGFAPGTMGEPPQMP